MVGPLPTFLLHAGFPVAGSPGYDPSSLLIPPAALASMSEFPRQFWGLKARSMDIVLFVRHGRCGAPWLILIMRRQQARD
jgi:hypothetical protein